jgi:hypothetical protein
MEDSTESEVPLTPLAHLYRWEGEDFGQNIWDCEHPRETHWEPREHIGSLMGSH